MKLIIKNSFHSKWDILTLDFDSKVPVNTGTFYSFDGLVTLKDIEKEVSDYLGINNWRSRVAPGIEKTFVYITDDAEYIRIKTIVKRDNIIENILNHDR